MSENKKTNQIQPPEELVLCGASAYNQKFYINENFKNLPDEIKNQLKVMCVLFCADIGGILQLVFDEEGNLEFRTACNEDDLLYDDIGSGLKIKELRQKNEDLLRGLELYYKVIFDKLDKAVSDVIADILTLCGGVHNFDFVQTLCLAQRVHSFRF